MHRLRIWIRNIFGFSQNETNGFLILLPVLLLILFSNSIYKQFDDREEVTDQAHQAKIDSLLKQWNFNPTPGVSETNIHRFRFDPNTATLNDFDSLGLPAYLSRRIVNYRNKGGSFKKPEDLSKIYGMDSALFRSILPYIQIHKAKTTSDLPQADYQKKPGTNYSSHIVFSRQDLNQADTIQLKAIKGIGTVLAARIVKYRNMLGGFVEHNQIREVYGLDTAVINRIQKQFYIDPAYKPAQLNINIATEGELAGHPYIRTKIAKSIVAYRFQHGSFNQITDLLKIDLIDQAIFDRIRPYLTTE